MKLGLSLVGVIAVGVIAVGVKSMAIISVTAAVCVVVTKNLKKEEAFKM
jgi:hypothetical protein